MYNNNNLSAKIKVIKISDEVLAHILNISISESNEISNNKQLLYDIEQNGKNIQSALLMLDEGISMIPSDERLHGVIGDLINLYLLSPETICLYGEISKKISTYTITKIKK